MNFNADPQLCMGSGVCESPCLEVFKLEGEKAQVILAPVSAELQASALSTEEGCPAQAISH